MSFWRRARVGLAVGFGASLLSMGASCYRAQIDLSPLVDDMSQSGGGAPMSTAGEASSGGTSEPISSGGASGAAGGDSTMSCDDALLDPVQERCHSVLMPTVADCHDGDPAGWDGCYAGGCVVCAEKVVDFKYYVNWHPCCQLNDTCNRNAPVTCNVRCPPPTDHDKVAPCFVISP